MKRLARGHCLTRVFRHQPDNAVIQFGRQVMAHAVNDLEFGAGNERGRIFTIVDGNKRGSPALAR